MDLLKKEDAYFFGFIQCDGHLSQSTRNRGRIQIELKDGDEELLEKFGKLSKHNYSVKKRTRDTNFKKNYTSVSLSIYNRDFRTEINSLGIPYGKKSDIIVMPNNISEIDYFRGIIDADGTLGITATGLPFIGFTTQSESLAKSFINFIHETVGQKKSLNRNNRDHIYSIIVMKENAQAIIRKLYYNDCLCLARKLQKAREALSWQRPKEMKKIISKRWDEQEVEYIKTHTIEESVKKLKRTKSSIKMKLLRTNL